MEEGEPGRIRSLVEKGAPREMPLRVRS